VVIGALTRLGGGVLNGVRRDVAGLVGILRPLPEPAAGLHTYRFTPAGGEVRVHLRVEADGRGVMFVDVTEVIHLNAPATLMAKLALDGVPLHTARAALAARTVAAGRAGVIAEVAEIYRLVSGYRLPGPGWHLPGLRQRAPRPDRPVSASSTGTLQGGSGADLRLQQSMPALLQRG
jgi:hypothetical protein